MICNSVFVAPRIVSPVGLVVPVELHGIRRGHVGPARGTGGTGVRQAHAAERENLASSVPPVPPTGPTKINKTACSTTGSTRSPGARRFSRKNENVPVDVTDEHLMTRALLGFYLRATPSDRGRGAGHGAAGERACHAHRSGTALPSLMCRRSSNRHARISQLQTRLTTILAAAKKAGVTFMERVTDGELVVEGLDHLAPDDRQKLQAHRNDIRNELLPDDTSTASLDLLGELGVELVHIENEQRAAAEVQRICATSRTLGLDIETAPLPEFLPKAWPIVVTKDGRRSKLQAKMDTSPALDPFRAEIRLLQVAAEIERQNGGARHRLATRTPEQSRPGAAVALQDDRAQS